MPFRWYVAALFVLIAWGVAIVWFARLAAPALPEKGGRVIELAGTLLTLLPVGLDLLRKFYVRRIAPPPGDGDAYRAWALRQVGAALLGYEWLYAVAVFLGVSLIALGFAVDLVGA